MVPGPRLGPGGEGARFVGAWHSVSHDGTGESDLELDVVHQGGRCRVLIEDKIDAEFQPNQPARSKSRGEAYVAAGECDRCRTVLAAPAGYSKGRAGAGEFDAGISYEEQRDWFRDEAGLGDRGRHKARLIDHAVTAAGRTWRVVPAQRVTAIWADYGRFVAANAPELVPPPPRPRPRSSTWVNFRMTDLHKRLWLTHRLPDGQVVLWVAGMGDAVSQLRERLAPYLEPDMTLAPASKSAGISLRVPVVDPTRSFAAARRLRLWTELHYGMMGH